MLTCNSRISRGIYASLLVVLLIVAVSPVGLVFADVPVVNRIETWTRTSNNHTVLNITVTHHNYYAGHYVDWVQIDANGTKDTVNLSEPQPVNSPFVVQYDLGEVEGSLKVQARANCNLHGSSNWSNLVDVGEASPLGGLLNPNATPAADLNLLSQIVVFVVLVAGFLIAKYRKSFRKHGGIMGFALVLHTIFILIVMGPSLSASRGLFGNLLSRLSIVFLSHTVLGSLVEILGIYLVGAWAFSRTGSKGCFRRKRIMQITVALWLLELVIGIYVYAMLYLAV